PGYHRLRRDGDGAERSLIVTPAHCCLPPGLRGWLLSVQLYALRGARSWGIGDLGALRTLARWTREQGGTSLLLNPLHAAAPTHPQEASPYYPSSRVYRNPLYLEVESVPGAEQLGSALEPLARAGRDLNGCRSIDRDRVWDLKRAALRRLYEAGTDDPAFAAWRVAEGAALHTFALYCAIAERHGARWTEWPASLRRPQLPGVADFERRHAPDVRFHAWLQWLLAGQLTAVAAELPPITDLAVGVDPQGADAWQWQDVLALGVTVGAPPDPFSEGGQNWGLPPFDPWRLRAVAYQPFRDMLRSALHSAAGLRIDHVMGLFRLFWIPQSSDPSDGAYVRYPADELLGIVALESRRAGGFVVGEDLGTVAGGVRASLRERQILSYRLLLFEDRPPADYPAEALAAATTHDLPTLTGLWGDPGLAPELRARVERAAGLGPDASAGDVVIAAERALAGSPSRLVAATLEDAAGVSEQPNHPGTVGGGNWSLALPTTVEALTQSEQASRLAAALH
ncbi:MAG: 4-alpha-glucanotransferase, partial [Candidatus Dormiibacterota bacterium]